MLQRCTLLLVALSVLVVAILACGATPTTLPAPTSAPTWTLPPTHMPYPTYAPSPLSLLPCLVLLHQPQHLSQPSTHEREKLVIWRV
jgi:hypothetical protein